MRAKMFSFQATATIEGIHPLKGGIFRRKYRRDHHQGMRRENPIIFYARYGAESCPRSRGPARCTGGTRRILEHVRRTPATEVDVAMQPVQDGDLDALELFTTTAGARAAADKQRKRKAALAAAEA